MNGRVKDLLDRKCVCGHSRASHTDENGNDWQCEECGCAGFVIQRAPTPPDPVSVPREAGEFVLVPKRPTPAMIEAGHHAPMNLYGDGVVPCVVHYRAMLSAAPSPPPTERGGLVKAIATELTETIAFLEEFARQSYKDHGIIRDSVARAARARGYHHAVGQLRRIRDEFLPSLSASALDAARAGEEGKP